MSILLRFETFGSRILACPRSPTCREDALRLRRHYHDPHLESAVVKHPKNTHGKGRQMKDMTTRLKEQNTERKTRAPESPVRKELEVRSESFTAGIGIYLDSTRNKECREDTPPKEFPVDASTALVHTPTSTELAFPTARDPQYNGKVEKSGNSFKPLIRRMQTTTPLKLETRRKRIIEIKHDRHPLSLLSHQGLYPECIGSTNYLEDKPRIPRIRLKIRPLRIRRIMPEENTGAPAALPGRPTDQMAKAKLPLPAHDLNDSKPRVWPEDLNPEPELVHVPLRNVHGSKPKTGEFKRLELKNEVPDIRIRHIKASKQRLWDPGAQVDFMDTVQYSFTPNKPADHESPELKHIQDAVAKKTPHAVLDAFLRNIHYFGMHLESLRSIPPDIFSEILRCLHPKHFVRRYVNLHREFSQQHWRQLALPEIHISGRHRFCTRFVAQMQLILKARSTWGLSLTDYAHLLKSTRETGDALAARQVWADMQKHGVAPDASCYNDYLASFCWADQFSAFGRYRLRITPLHMDARRWRPVGTQPYRLRYHVVGGLEGIKNSAARIFQQMLEARVAGNEETFCLMMMALAREGDMSGIASILKRVWGIDVEALETNDGVEACPLREYSPDSPFYPSSNILFAVAHVYGINSSIPTALRLVDYISRQYDIPIPLQVWNELLMWTFVLTMRMGKRHEGLDKADQLPPEAVLNLWTTMTSPPYNAKPTMAMYNLVIRSLLYRRRYGEVKIYMEQARRLHVSQVRVLSRMHRITRASRIPRALDQSFISKAQRDLNFAKLRVRRNRLYIRRWVDLWIWQGSKSLRHDPTFAAKDITRFLEVWELFIPRRVRYNVAAGTVEFVTDSRAANTRRQITYGRRAFARRSSVLRDRQND